MHWSAKCLSAVSFWCVAQSALAVTCGSSTNDEYYKGDKPVIHDPDLNESVLELCKQEYNLKASNVTGTNLWSAQHLTASRARGGDEISRVDMSFTSETGFAAKHASYTSSGYDRGHMMPANDASTTDAQKETFSIANVVPQTPKLNRYTWRDIEVTVHELAKTYGEVYVVTGPDFANMATTINGGKVVVPTETWKAVYVPDAGVAGAYWCKNTSAPTCEIISINALEDAAWVDAFPALASSLRDQTASDWKDVLILP